jgi:hypothetical protein
MSQWTYIIGRIVVSPLGYSHEQRLNTLKNIISTLPSVTGSEGNMQITFNQSDEEYVLKIKGGLRDRQTEQTVKEYEKFICNLKQKIDVEKLYVEIKGQNQKFIDKG